MASRRRTTTSSPLYFRPPEKSVAENIREFFWNPHEHTLCGRTPLNWTTIIIYYILFLSATFLILYGCLEVVRYIAISNDPHKPRYSGKDSPIGNNPSVNYFPLNTEVAPLLRLDDDVSYYVDKIDKTFAEYKDCDEKDNATKCFNLTALGECGSSPYGYKRGFPCLYIKLNRILEWTPVAYASNDTLPDDMPDEIKKMVNGTESKIWVHCKGNRAVDFDHLGQERIMFEGGQGFDPSFFPFSKQSKFYDPLVAIKINTTDLMSLFYAVKCSAWGVEFKSVSEFVLKKPRTLSETERKLIRDAFDLFDVNGDGFIDYYELKASTRCLGFQMKKQEIMNILQTYDRENKYQINYEDFYEIMERNMQKRDPLDEVREAFKLIANDKTNAISYRDLKYAADRVGADIPDRDLRSMIEEFDTKGEGKLDEDDFISIMTGETV